MHIQMLVYIRLTHYNTHVHDSSAGFFFSSIPALQLFLEDYLLPLCSDWTCKLSLSGEGEPVNAD